MVIDKEAWRRFTLFPIGAVIFVILNRFISGSIFPHEVVIALQNIGFFLLMLSLLWLGLKIRGIKLVLVDESKV